MVMRQSAKCFTHNSTATPEVQQRVRRLMYWQMDNLAARTEWSRIMLPQPATTQSQLARYAFEQQWADLAQYKQRLLAVKCGDHLEERFPLAWQNEFERYNER